MWIIDTKTLGLEGHSLCRDEQKCSFCCVFHVNRVHCPAASPAALDARDGAMVHAHYRAQSPLVLKNPMR